MLVGECAIQVNMSTFHTTSHKDCQSVLLSSPSLLAAGQQPVFEGSHLPDVRMRPNSFSHFPKMFQMIQWNIVLFSETRGIHGQCMIGNGHKLFTSLQPTASAGVAVLIPLLHVTSVNATLLHVPCMID